MAKKKVITAYVCIECESPIVPGTTCPMCGVITIDQGAKKNGGSKKTKNK